MQNLSVDVAIIGGGAAGLACALKLDPSPLRYAIIEARPRLGGRMYSKNLNNNNLFIDLGAEFIHGAPASILGLMDQLGLAFYDVGDGHLFIELIQWKKIVWFLQGES